MAYLTMFVSEIPIIPTYTSDQKIYVRAEVTVPDEFRGYPAEGASRYLKSLAEVIREDIAIIHPEIKLEATSMPPLASPDEPPSSD